MDHADRRVPFENMVYVGDGPSDIPCFSMIKYLGGRAVGVTPPDDSDFRRPYELAEGQRLTVGPYTADFRDNSDLFRMMARLVTGIADTILEKRDHSLRRLPAISGSSRDCTGIRGELGRIHGRRQVLALVLGDWLGGPPLGIPEANALGCLVAGRETGGEGFLTTDWTLSDRALVRCTTGCYEHSTPKRPGFSPFPAIAGAAYGTPFSMSHQKEYTGAKIHQNLSRQLGNGSIVGDNQLRVRPCSRANVYDDLSFRLWSFARTKRKG